MIVRRRRGLRARQSIPARPGDQPWRRQGHPPRRSRRCSGSATARASIDLFEALMRGRYRRRADRAARALRCRRRPRRPSSRDLADFTNLVTRLKVVPAAADDVSLTPDERTRGPALAQKLGMRALSRARQILFKGGEEVQRRPATACRPPRWCWCASPMRASCRRPDEIIAQAQGNGAARAAAARRPPRHRRMAVAVNAGPHGPAQWNRAALRGGPGRAAARRPRRRPCACSAHLRRTRDAGGREARRRAQASRSRPRCARCPSAMRSIEVALVAGARSVDHPERCRRA